MCHLSGMSTDNHTQLPVWLRIKQTTELYPLGRSTIYSLIEKGLIKSTTTRVDKNQRYGCRLINRASLEDFLESRATGGDAQSY